MLKNTPQVNSDIKGHKRRVFLIGIVATLAMFLVWVLGGFEKIELASYDLRFLARGARAPQTPIAIVGIDDESLNVWMDEQDVQRKMPDKWTWPRGFYATVVDNLSRAGASLIAFDMVFSESSSKVCGVDNDKLFADACKRAGNVILAERFVAKKLSAGQSALKQETLIGPLDAARRDKGHANVFPGVDGSYRSFRVVLPQDGRLEKDKINLDLAVARQFLFGKALAPTMAGPELITLGGKDKALRIPHDGWGSVDINFVGPPESFPTFKFHDVYFRTMDMSVFKGRIVFIGSTSSILHDNHSTPFAGKEAPMPGVEIHANMVETLLTQDHITRHPPYVELLLLLAFGLVTSLLTFRVRNPKLGAAVAALELVTYGVFCFYVFVAHNQVLPMVSPMAAAAASFLGIAVYRGVVEEKKARSTRAMFSRYVSRQIVDEILKNPEGVTLGGQMKEVSILFSDVRGFTAMSEKLSAPEVVEVLNEYLTRMVDIVIANNGTLDKYVGDAIMAVWGSPLHDPRHEENAVRTAVMMMEVLAELRAKWRLEGKPDIDIGIGINSGHVVAGNMGHPDFKMDYTVIGDDVNLAARLESANKELKAHLLISGSTYAKTIHLVDVVKHPDIHVKGKEKAVEVYEVVGWKGQGRAPWAVPLKG